MARLNSRHRVRTTRQEQSNSRQWGVRNNICSRSHLPRNLILSYNPLQAPALIYRLTCGRLELLELLGLNQAAGTVCRAILTKPSSSASNLAEQTGRSKTEVFQARLGFSWVLDRSALTGNCALISAGPACRNGGVLCAREPMAVDRISEKLANAWDAGTP